MNAGRMCREGCMRLAEPGRKTCATHSADEHKVTETRRLRRAQRYGPDHQKRSKRLRDRANGDTRVLCALCGLPRRVGDPWEADHRFSDSSALQITHSSCNRAKGEPPTLSQFYGPFGGLGAGGA